MARTQSRAHKQPEVQIELKRWEPTGYGARGERFPFSALKPATRLDDSPRGGLEGESFFIPLPVKNANSYVQRARYMLDAKFATRSETQIIKGKSVEGLRVWRLPADG